MRAAHHHELNEICKSRLCERSMYALAGKLRGVRHHHVRWWWRWRHALLVLCHWVDMHT